MKPRYRYSYKWNRWVRMFTPFGTNQMPFYLRSGGENI